MTTAAGDRTAAAARRSRPRNRRELIVRAATDRFYRLGYHAVAMSDIATDVGVAPSALYRHFAGKQDLLAATVEDGIRPVLETFTDRADGEGLDATVRLAVQRALEDRRVGLLWLREMRNLDPANRTRIGRQVTSVAAGLAGRLRAERPGLSADAAGLLAWCAVGVLNSVSLHSLTLPPPQLEDLVSELTRRVLEVDAPVATPVSPVVVHHLVPVSRRERLVTQAALLFSEQGYDAVTMDEIGAAAGIAGPSVYNHFETKADVLAATVVRGTEWIRVDLAKVLARTDDPADALRQLVAAYVDMATAHPEMMGIEPADSPHTEVARLRQESRTAQREYVGEWVHLLRSARAGLVAAEAEITVRAFFGMVNGVVRVPRLQPIQAFPATLVVAGRALLFPPGPTGVPPGRG